MDQLLCAIYDRLANEVIGNLMLFKTDVVALRTWRDIVNTENSQVRLHLKDYEMVVIGILNTNTLQLTPKRETIMTGTQWAAMEEAERSAQ